MISVN